MLQSLQEGAEAVPAQALHRVLFLDEGQWNDNEWPYI